ncbi:ParM/StbA family protein [Paenibacillus sp. L3-i20]|uniref:ParM/StbA family protein n=1 Tax=Paenibacillus sp. L3-i20 TaxID=2905833 RepID=UPI001EDD1474|nr:ParM/StbA family protein [Paenibacillus sp. L3-i20]GKU79835.1 hypothetical protein L3i20_v242320 [Paenibacillus sp. L3-i20]
MGIAAIDAGGKNTKFYDGKQLIMFPSAIGINELERNLKSEHAQFEYEWEYEGKKGFAGTLAEESEYAESRRDDSKAHFDAILRILIALHQFGEGISFNIVVGQPIETHNETEKIAIKTMLQRRHDLTINGKAKTIIINRCEVTPEGATAGLLTVEQGLVRIIDIGSGSVNYGTLKNRKFLNKGSFTFTEGMESKTNLNIEAFARQIGTKAINKKWGKEDVVYLCGGGAEVILPYLKAEFFPNGQLLAADPLYSNVKAFFMIARKLYG